MEFINLFNIPANLLPSSEGNVKGMALYGDNDSLIHITTVGRTAPVRIAVFAVCHRIIGTGTAGT